MTVQRPIAEIEDYALRLHQADPLCTEPIPVSPDEAFTLQEDRLRNAILTDRNCFKMNRANILGHAIKIL